MSTSNSVRAIRIQIEEMGTFERMGFTHFIIQGLVESDLPDAELPSGMSVEDFGDVGGYRRRRLIISAEYITPEQAAALALYKEDMARHPTRRLNLMGFKYFNEKDYTRTVTLWQSIAGISRVGFKCAA